MAFALRVFWTAGDRSVTSEFHTEWAGTTVPYKNIKNINNYSLHNEEGEGIAR